MTLITDIKLPRKKKDAFEAAQKFLKDFKEPTGIHYAKVRDKGEVKPFMHQACHSQMGNNTAEDFAYVATPFVMTPQKKDLCKAFIHWLHHESPLARFIVNTGTDTEHLGSVVPMNLYRGIVQSICIMSRHPYEVAPDKFECWNKAVSEGYDPFLMVMVLFNTSWDPSAPNYYFHGVEQGHRMWGLGIKKEATLAALKGVLNPSYRGDSLEYTMREKPSIYGGMQMFGDTDISTEIQRHFTVNPAGRYPGFLLDTDEAWDALFKHREKVLNISSPKEEGYRPPNPWVRDRSSIGLCIDKNNYRQKIIRNCEVMDFVVPYISSLPEIQQAIKERCY